MNLQQLEYILAVDELRHFAKAAEYCNVTQPTLSAMIQPVYLQPIITQYFIDNKSEIWLLFLIAHSKR